MKNRRPTTVHALGVGFALALSTLATSVAAASPQDQLRVRALVATTCFQCHGTHGRAVPGTAMVSLAGMDRNHLRDSLLAFRDGTRQGTVMNQLMRGFTPEQIDVISTYFAQLRP
jgi:cytochrome c553